ncbi:MAG: hybrid sensor histidine kinase/response regulator [Phototrophicaceae bacterium]
MKKNDYTTHNHHILVVEDDLLLGGLITEAIGHSYSVTLLNSAENVLQTLNTQSIDLVVLDLMLPNVNGFELLDAIREQYNPDELIIIIMSAVGRAQSIVKGFEHGANDYIVKPAELSVMMARIDTQLKLRELQLEHKRYIDYLERGEQLRKQLNQIASHDLKNPINNLRIAEGLLREELAGNKRLFTLLNTVDASLDMMEQIVEAFLDMVAIQTDSIKLKSEPVIIRDIINNVYTQYELAAYKKEIKLLVGNTDGIIIGDAGRVIQVVGNLISNALKYSPKQSSITIWSEINNDSIRLNVLDSGEGIPENERHLLFTEFGKLSTRPTDGENSTGLGLWIVKQLIEMQDGRAGADFSHPDGSIFWIEMPIYNLP